MPEIKFSHKYPKIWNQKTAELIGVRLVNAEDIAKNKDIIEYDTYWNDSWDNNWTEFEVDIPHIDGWYDLPKEGMLIQLIFIGNKGIPFCTLRRHTEGKFMYYENFKGQKFDIVIENGNR